MSLIYVVFIAINIFFPIHGRSILRKTDPCMPEIITKWSDENKTYRLRDYHLEEHALFTKFNHEHFMSHQLPRGPIIYRYDKNKSVDGEQLHKLAQHLLTEIYSHKKEYTHFKILKNSEFNIRAASGTAILKYKKYPFVLKLFIKTPETFVRPFSEGFVPSCFFIMAGGINPYLCGFTRIKNLEIIKEKIDNDPYWSKIIDLPRKWFWMPTNNRWFILTGKNIGNKPVQSVKLPSVYAIIADAIKSKKTLSLLNKRERKLAIQFSNYLDNCIDAHVDNFMIEKGTNKVILVDTEHFPTKVGLKSAIKYSTYASWYCQLAWKCFTDKFTHHRSYRENLQKNPCPALIDIK